ncbi:hypothetical protein RR48_00951 [Papilio machaon]|uniref:Uncharacterized protein n=1 Tax=Papilio machaon TaxID=76193 RepID=A0A0N1IF90_PAPMA|nr:hypothetical protein RR48_00951 [Papilio machaon]
MKRSGVRSGDGREIEERKNKMMGGKEVVARKIIFGYRSIKRKERKGRMREGGEERGVGRWRVEEEEMEERGRRREKREVKWWRSSGVIEEDDWKEWMER